MTASDIVTNVFFQSKPCLSSHVSALMNYPQKYLEMLRFLHRSGTFAIVTSAVRARILASLHVLSMHEEVVELMKHCELTDVSKALMLLDRPRLARQMTKKIQAIEDDHPQLASPPQPENDQDSNREKKKRKRCGKIDLCRRKRQSIEADIKEANHNWEECSEAHEDTAVQEMIQSASVSGALARKVRRWAKDCLQSGFLEFVMLTLPSDPWKTLADLVHFSPSDFAVPYFLDDVYKDKSEAGSANLITFVARIRELTENAESDDIDERFFRVAKEFPQVYSSYSFVRTQPKLMSRPAIVERFASRAPLATVIWFYEELHRASARTSVRIVSERLRGGSSAADDLLAESPGGGAAAAKSKATYGKLVERILTFRRMRLRFADDIISVAEARLEQLKSSWAKDAVGGARVAVFGDASSSMQRAIEAATIFASMASACLDGELSFFQSELVRSPHEKPGSARETLEVCDKIRAKKCTANAAALWPYYRRKKAMDLFVMVTDEEENSPYKGHKFADLFEKYLKEVNSDAKLVIVCVGKGYPPFRASLKNHNISYKVVYIDESRPDLAKFDALLGQLVVVSSRCTATSKRHEHKENEIDGGSTEEDDFVLVDDE